MRYKTPKQELYNKAKATIRVIIYDPIKNKIVDSSFIVETLKEAKETFNYIDNLLHSYSIAGNFETHISINTELKS